MLGDDFLERFSRDLIQGLDARANLVAEQKGGWIEIHCKVVGEAKVECDRCLEELQMPLGIDQRLTIRFDAEPGDVVNEDDNIIILREGTSEVDLAQTIYDLICVSLPMQRVHPEGQCSQAALSRLSDEAAAKKDAPANTPFSGLKDLLKLKQEK